MPLRRHGWSEEPVLKCTWHKSVSLKNINKYSDKNCNSLHPDISQLKNCQLNFCWAHLIFLSVAMQVSPTIKDTQN